MPAKQLHVLLNTLILLGVFWTPVYADLLIYHINVRMGDSTLIFDTKSNKTLLVDSGNRGYGRQVISPDLKALGFNKIDYFVATHYDIDHIGGFHELIETGIQIKKNVFDRGDFTEKLGKPAFERYIKATKDNDSDDPARTRSTYEMLCGANNQTNDLIQLGEDTSVQVVAVAGTYLLDDEGCETKKKEIKKSADNDLSIALVVRQGEFAYFIGGDLTGGGKSTKDMESLVMDAVGDVDILKLNHHGSNTSSNQQFLTHLSPEVVVISVGNGGLNLRYRLPNKHVINRIEGLPKPPEVYLTNQGETEMDNWPLPRYHVANGNIVVHTNGKGYSVNGKVFPDDKK